MQAQRGSADIATGNVGEKLVIGNSCCERACAARRLADRRVDGVNGLPHGLIDNNAVIEAGRMGGVWHSPHAAVGCVATLQASRACLIDARDRPGGERHDATEHVPEGVAGTVCKVVSPKRHRRFSVEEDSDALSSEVLSFPASVVCSALSRSSMNTRRGTFFISASNLRRDAPSFAFNSMASPATRVFAERTAAVDNDAPIGAGANAIALAEEATEEEAPHDVTGAAPSLQASRACLIDARDNPGGEPTSFARALSFLTVGGVAGTVCNEVLPKRHCLPGAKDPVCFSAVTVLCAATTPHASRACRIAARDKPGGERCDAWRADPIGVAGIVSNSVQPKRQRLPESRPTAPSSVPDILEELSVSEALPRPISVVSSSFSNSSFSGIDNLWAQVSTGSMTIISTPKPGAIFGLEWLSNVQ